jgi:hypothetical protein
LSKRGGVDRAADYREALLRDSVVAEDLGNSAGDTDITIDPRTEVFETIDPTGTRWVIHTSMHHEAHVRYQQFDEQTEIVGTRALAVD